MSLPRFVVDAALVRGDSDRLDADTVQHVRALRLRPGDRLVLTDGAGGQRAARLASLAPGEARVVLTPDVLPETESRLALTLCVALLKRDKLEWVVEKGTELGVTRFVLVDSARSLADARRVRVDRLERVARAAVEQAQRCRVPELVGPLAFDAALAAAADSAPRLFLWEEARTTWPAASAAGAAPARVALMTGPEGGFRAEEAERAAAAGWHVVRVGARVLRAETAAVAAAALAQAAWGDLCTAAPDGDACPGASSP